MGMTKKLRVFAVFVLIISILIVSCACRQDENDGAADAGDEGSVNDTVCENKTDGESEADTQIKNVILIIGDGMGLSHITAGELAYGEHFDFSDWSYTSVNTNSLDSSYHAKKLTDSAAAATALATGTLTVNGYVGVDKDKNELETILDHAKSLGKKTGVLTTDKLYGATPAAFSAHAESRNETEAIVYSQLESNVDLLLGASSGTCKSAMEKIVSNGYTYAESLEQIDKNADCEKMYCLLGLEGYTEGENAVKLKDAARSAIGFLENENGFVLVVEQAHIDKFSHSNDFENAVKSVKSLNDTVSVVMEWAKDRNDTAVIVTSDHETGDLSVSADPILDQIYINENNTQIYYSFKSTGHTDSYVGLFLYGVDFDFSSLPYMKSSRVIKNTDVPIIIRRVLENQQPDS